MIPSSARSTRGAKAFPVIIIEVFYPSHFARFKVDGDIVFGNLIANGCIRGSYVTFPVFMGII